jgi:hypothetical protein
MANSEANLIGKNRFPDRTDQPQATRISLPRTLREILLFLQAMSRVETNLGRFEKCIEAIS